MANFKVHALVGAGVGFGAYCVKYNIEKTLAPERKFDWERAAIWTGIGVLGACLPDWLEPATSPHHRAFFHSFTVLAAILWSLLVLSAGTVSAVGLFFAAGIGYASHLLLDGCSRRSLPWF
jgi:membrane-bound metal-dependent hydrolase YbcI (DUF457 family)